MEKPEDTKPQGEPTAQPEGNANGNPQPNPGADTVSQQITELQSQLKERDSKIADLSTTISSIEERYRQMNKTQADTAAYSDLQERTKRIMQNASFDPETAAVEMTNLLNEIKSGASTEAFQKAQQAVEQQNAISRFKEGIKSKNPLFDDDIVNTVIQQADEFAKTGRYKTADEAINAATDYIRNKLEAYASKRNAVPPLPEGARAEAGVNNAPVTPKKEAPITPQAEISNRQTQQMSKIF